MTSPQKSKGNKFENEVAEFLSETYGDSFVRVPGSGARVGGQNKHRKLILSENQIKSFKGDIIPPDHWSNFHCEAKWYKDFLFHQLFTNECPLLDTWISQVREAEDPGDFNIITMKFNYKGRWICVEQKHNFVIQNALEYREWVFCTWDNFWTQTNTDIVENLSVIKDCISN